MTTATTGASLAFAKSLFTRGTDTFGSEDIKQVFGLDHNIGEVPISFTEEELRRARDLDQMLVLQSADITMRRIHELTGNKTSDGKPLFCDKTWYENEEFFTTDVMRPGWRLVSRTPIPGSRNQNYLDQTATLVAYLTESVFKGVALPKMVAEAIAEFQQEKKALTKLLNSNLQEAAKRLVVLKVNQMFRENPVEALWSLALYEGVNHERLLPGSWTWIDRLSSYGSVVYVGDFDGDGVAVDDDNPGRSDDDLGVCFSRSGNLE